MIYKVKTKNWTDISQEYVLDEMKSEKLYLVRILIT